LFYRKGAENRAADALSRRQDESLAAISECQPAWQQDVRHSYSHNQHATQWINKLQVAPNPKNKFSLQDGILYFRNRICLDGSTTLQQQILKAFHSSAIGGHSGFPVTYQRIRRLFAWPKMKQHIKEFVQTCMIC
jgi:hypothetical protein